MIRSVLLLSALVLAGGCTKKIDESKVEKAIADKFSGVKVTVTCPKDVEVKKDGTFNCQVKGDGVDLSVEVTMADGDGKVVWKTPFDSKTVVDEIRKQRPTIQIECPNRFVSFAKKGDKFSCKAVDGDEKGKAVVTLEDPVTGTFHWKIEADKPEGKTEADKPEGKIEADNPEEK